MMFFRDYTFKWWQVSMFKLSLLLGGIAIGAYWHENFYPYIVEIIALALAFGIYIAYVSSERK